MIQTSTRQVHSESANRHWYLVAFRTLTRTVFCTPQGGCDVWIMYEIRVIKLFISMSTQKFGRGLTNWCVSRFSASTFEHWPSTSHTASCCKLYCKFPSLSCSTILRRALVCSGAPIQAYQHKQHKHKQHNARRASGCGKHHISAKFSRCVECSGGAKFCEAVRFSASSGR